MMAVLANELIAAFPDCVAADGSLDLAKLTGALETGILKVPNEVCGC